MDLKQSAEIRTYIDNEGQEQVRDIVLKNVRFNYSWLVDPRKPDREGATPSYETTLIIEDPETWNVFAQYFSYVYEKAVIEKWGNKRPDYTTGNMNTPFYVPKQKDDGTWGDFEEGAIAIIKSRNNQAPELFIRLGNEPIRQPQTEADFEEFYSGMIGDAVISLWAYDKDTKKSIMKPGIRSFLIGVCKTDHGTPILFNRNNYDLLGAFGGDGSAASAFAQPQPAQQVIQPQPQQITPQQIIPQPAQPQVIQPQQVKPVPGLNQILGGGVKPNTPQQIIPQPAQPAKPNILQPNPAAQPIEQEPEKPQANLLQDLINKGLAK